MKTVFLLRRLALLALVTGLMPVSSQAQEVAAGTVIDLPKPAHVRIFSDLPYTTSGNPSHKLDLYLPSPVPPDPLPLIIYLHGGGWQKGSKVDGRRFAFRMVAQGYAVACVDYRLSSEELFPAQLEDCKSAVRWLRKTATRYRLDSNHFGVVGVSAGGYLAVLLGTTRSTFMFDIGEQLDQPSAVQAVCDFFGPVDLVRLYDYSVAAKSPQADEVVKFLGGDPHVQKAQAHKSNPLTYLDNNAPRFLLVHGAEDTVVPPEQSRLLFDALAKLQNIPVQFHLIHGAGHTGPAFVAPDINAIVDTFFARALKTAPQSAVPIALTESTAAKN